MKFQLTDFDNILKILDLLACFQFNDKGNDLRSQVKIVAVKDQFSVPDSFRSCIIIPINPKKISESNNIWTCNIDDAKINLWSKIDRPIEWEEIKSNGYAFFYRNSKKNLIMPAWDFIACGSQFLNKSSQENYETDQLGRIISKKASFHKNKFDEQPYLNNINFLLLNAALLIKKKKQKVSSFISPLKLMLSHDIDLIRSNDLLSQLIRIKRLLNSLFNKKFNQSFLHFYSFIKSIFLPYRNYSNSIYGIIDLEKQFGFSSSFYFLVGKKGRLGPRTSAYKTLFVANKIPKQWNVGIHYNYDSFIEKDSLKSQIKVFNKFLNRKIYSGRAHYFIFDFFKDSKIISDNGIKVDESLSWHDTLGFKFGIAGPLIHSNSNIKTIFIPTIFMDQLFWKSENNFIFNSSYQHLKKVGGIVSFLVHNDIFFNPENSFFIGKYHKLLKKLFEDNIKSYLPDDIYKICKSKNLIDF